METAASLVDKNVIDEACSSQGNETYPRKTLCGCWLGETLKQQVNIKICFIFLTKANFVCKASSLKLIFINNWWSLNKDVYLCDPDAPFHPPLHQLHPNDESPTKINFKLIKNGMMKPY